MSEPDSGRDAAIRQAFLKRAVAGLERVAATAPYGALSDALSAATDLGMVAAALSRPDVLGAAVVELDPGADRAAAFAAEAAELVALAGGLMGVEEVAAFLRISRQAVDKRRRSGTLLAIPQGAGWRYPRCQFGETGVLGGVPNFVGRLSRRGPWGVLRALVSADEALGGRSPAAMLSGGRDDRAAVARRLDGLARADWGGLPGAWDAA